MTLMALKLEHLKNLDGGKVAIAWEDLLRKAVQDCQDRPGDSAARVITLKATITPIATGRELDSTSVEFEVDAKIPKKRSRAYAMNPHANGQLSFSEDFPDNPNQKSLLDTPE